MHSEERLLDDSGGGGGDDRGVRMDDLDNLIDLVARANDVHIDPGNIFPSVRASPCPINNRQFTPQDRPGLDPLYSTSCHGGKVSSPRIKLTGDRLFDTKPPPLPLSLADAHKLQGYSHSECTPRGGRESDLKEVRDRRKKGGILYGLGIKDSMLSPKERYNSQFQLTERHMPAKLPEEMPTKDVVMSWLKHGSAPEGESHFPDILQPPSKGKARQKRKPSAVSE